MDLQIYALCEELERNPPSNDPKNDYFCDHQDSPDECDMIESLDWQFKQLLQTELLPYRVSCSSGEADKLAHLLRTKEEYIQLCVSRLSHIRSSMFKAINHEPQLIRLAARYYMEKEALVRRLGELVRDIPEGELPRDLEGLREEDIRGIFSMPFGRERTERVVGVLKRHASGVV
ncbi:YALIA101S06e01486g1_1 [Yarrowia lipolytica]|jgi:hypothetical protein|uniref:Uncharacterized protein n=1 Tax=Yarrowia lipolytica TaxID=4952 RepID=A0A1D8NGA8_YARLL|nr:hypothetical protein YALI1_D34573g [Yarrowia lipolytica]RMI99188.1 hypothetical protein BD777DRAFT_157365 [Yarrowia lipolytica]SEI35079.1 YALIA101S06e01486g1_1 [Yarrowia lipolytica]VBB88562.1 Hypothetical protein conserved in the Yarrowia clade [Yarrowia lipolytica]